MDIHVKRHVSFGYDSIIFNDPWLPEVEISSVDETLDQLLSVLSANSIDFDSHRARPVFLFRALGRAPKTSFGRVLVTVKGTNSKRPDHWHFVNGERGIFVWREIQPRLLTLSEILAEMSRVGDERIDLIPGLLLEGSRHGAE